MSRNPNDPALADYVVLVLSPILIMILIGSLVFFLMETLYTGEHVGSMQWVMFFLVFAAVLTGRISMHPDIAPRAFLYWSILGLLGWLAIDKYVEFPRHLADYAPLMSLGFILLILWCAYQLTWDCTFLDDSVGASGEGVLQAAGLESEGSEPETSIERYRQKQQNEDGKKRTPGVWVIWFSLAALPIFGLGQSLIPTEALERRRYTFWLMILYVGSGLGLLLTTSFLGLRLYLQRRRLRMPAAITASWLTLGTLLTVALLVVGALLPRPRAEVTVIDFDPAGSKEVHGKRQDIREGQGKEDQAAGQEEKDGQRAGKDRGDDPGKERKDSAKGKDKGESSNRSGDKKGDRSKGNKPSPNTPDWLANLLPILRVIVLIVLGLVILFVLMRALLQWAGGFSAWARNLLRAWRRFWEAFWDLFRRKGPTGGSVDQAEMETLARQPFETFSNPFQDSRASRMTAQELARYTFAALQSWARERGLGRQKGETAQELAERLGMEVPPLDRDVECLAHLYALAVYSRSGMPPNCLELLEHFWETLQRATEQPLSA
jgi:hypothetical protein